MDELAAKLLALHRTAPKAAAASAGEFSLDHIYALVTETATNKYPEQRCKLFRGRVHFLVNEHDEEILSYVPKLQDASVKTVGLVLQEYAKALELEAKQTEAGWEPSEHFLSKGQKRSAAVKIAIEMLKGTNILASQLDVTLKTSFEDLLAVAQVIADARKDDKS